MPGVNRYTLDAQSVPRDPMPPPLASRTDPSQFHQSPGQSQDRDEIWGTRLVVSAVAKLSVRPQVFKAASMLLLDMCMHRIPFPH